MTYSVGSVIQASDYANIANSGIGGNSVLSVNSIWNSNYGQSALSVPAFGDLVTATQWSTLFTTVTKISNHTGTSISTLTNPSTGDVIAVKAQLESDIGNLYTARGNASAVGTQYGTFSGTISKTSGTGSGSSPWTITFTNTVSFANTTAYSNFFNAGGIVKWDCGKTSTGTEADTEWNDLASTLSGQLYITKGGVTQGIAGTNYTGTTLLGNSTGASTLTTSQGATNGLTTSNTTVYQHYADTPPYTTQYIQVQLKVDNASSPTQLIITTTWSDPGGSGTGSTDAISGGTATSSPSTTITGTAPTVLVTYFPPETTYLTNTWGTPTISGSVA